MKSSRFKPSLLSSLLVSLISCNAFADSKPAVDYSDVFALEYPASPQFSNNGDTLYYVKRSMDKMTDSSISQVWKHSLEKQNNTPVLADVVGLISYRISPQGDRIAYTARSSSGPQLFMHYLAENKTVQLTQLEKSPFGITWSPSGESLAFFMRVEQTTPSFFKGMPAAPKGAKWADTAKVIDHIQYRADGGGYTKPGYTSVFLISAEGGIAKQLGKEGVPHSGSIEFSNDGTTLFTSANLAEVPELVPFGDDIVSYDVKTAEFKQVTDQLGSEVSSHISPDGKWLAYLYIEDQKLSYQFPELVIHSLKNGKERKLSVALDRSIQDLAWSPDSKHLVMSYLDAGKTRLAKAKLDGDIIGLPVELGGQSLGRPYTSGEFTVSINGDIAFTSSSSQRPAELELLNAKNRVSPITNMNHDWLTQRALADVQPLEVTSSVDGIAIDAWIATPPNFDPNKTYPLILEIHGGPHATYGPQFAMEIQLMAAKGYVVVWSNPRGSSSYGSEFGNLIHHDYPSKDYNDLMDVVDVAAAASYVDKENLFITGGSGGGTLTAWSIGKTDRFKAAVVAKPVINWMSFSLTADAYPYFTQYWMEKMPWNNHETLWQHSPLSLVGNVSTPTMLLTGESDYRTPISETEQYYQALKLNGIESAMVRLPGASHGIASRPTRLMQKVGNIIAWFDKYKTEEK